jgi:hypothetical protein
VKNPDEQIATFIREACADVCLSVAVMQLDAARVTYQAVKRCDLRPSQVLQVMHRVMGIIDAAILGLECISILTGVAASAELQFAHGCMDTITSYLTKLAGG